MGGIYGTTRSYSKEMFDRKLEHIKLIRGADFTRLSTFDKVTFGTHKHGVNDSNLPLSCQHLLITFDGKIYNHNSLKKSLETKGYFFTTESDTELLDAAFQEYGIDCVLHLNGAFAFAIYDSVKKIIFGARDRLGEKPFHYSINDGFEFSSQSLPIKLGRKDIHIDDKSVQRYLLFGHIPEPDSIYKEIKKLSPGTSFVYDTKNDTFKTTVFWSVQNVSFVSYSKSYAEAQTDLHALLDDAVQLRLQSDTNVATFLSGGIDSTLMTALCKKYSDTIEAFSIGFPQSNMDESQDAKLIAKHLGIKHTIIECSPKESLELISNITTCYDEPFADSSAIPSMLLCKKVKPFAPVAIAGDGGDESFIGYLRTKWIHQVSTIYKIPQSLRVFFANIIAFMPNYRIKSIARGLKHERIEDLIMKLLASQYFFSKETITGLAAYQNLIKHDSIPLFQKIADLDLQFYMLNDCIIKMDRAAAFAGMEVRAPLMDYRVVEFARNLPIEYRYGKGVQKRILKDILYTYVPKGLLDRPKSGFAIPLQDWFRNELKDFVYDVLSENNLNRIPSIDKEMIRKNIRLHMEHKLNFYAEIWKLIVLLKWLQGNE